jgi:uncharacterized membrane protein
VTYSTTLKILLWLAFFGAFAYASMSDILTSPIWKRVLSLVVMLSLVVLTCELLIPKTE